MPGTVLGADDTVMGERSTVSALGEPRGRSRYPVDQNGLVRPLLRCG